jgi:hypothetical protein
MLSASSGFFCLWRTCPMLRCTSTNWKSSRRSPWRTVPLFFCSYSTRYSTRSRMVKSQGSPYFWCYSLYLSER